jgi:hypothetical protein
VAIEALATVVKSFIDRNYLKAAADVLPVLEAQVSSDAMICKPSSKSDSKSQEGG